jgi:hypothetical protein
MENSIIFICPYRKSMLGEAEIMAKSITKHCKTPNKIVFVGDNPKIIGTECINYVSGLRTKEARVADQLIMAVSELGAKHFVLINDDIFAMRDFNYLPLYHSGQIKNQLKKYHSTNVYRKTLENSIQKDDDLNFAVHYPMPVDDVKKFITACEMTIEMKYNSIRNLYGNMVKKKYSDKVVQTKDCKLFSKGNSDKIAQVLEYSDGWLSVGDNWFTPANKKAVIQMLQQ